MTLARFALGGAVVAAVAFGVWTAHRGEEASDPHQKQLESRIAALEGARPEQIQRVIQREIRTELSPGSAALASEAQQEEAEVAVAAGRAFRTNAELAAAYAASFANEPVNTTWAADAERRYLPAIRDALPSSSRLLSFECRSQFCDVAIMHDSIEVSNGFILDLFAMDRHGPLAQDTAGFRAGEPVRTADGKLVYHLYIGRPGAQLAIDPSLNPPAGRNEKAPEA